MAPRQYLNLSSNIVNKTLRNKLQWHFNRNSNIPIEENMFENIVCKMLSISYQPQCINYQAIGVCDKMFGIFYTFYIQKYAEAFLT